MEHAEVPMFARTMGPQDKNQRCQDAGYHPKTEAKYTQLIEFYRWVRPKWVASQQGALTRF